MKCFDCNSLILHYKIVYVYRASTDFVISFFNNQKIRSDKHDQIGFPTSRYPYNLVRIDWNKTKNAFDHVPNEILGNGWS